MVKLMAGNGTKTLEAWDAMSAAERTAFLAGLDDAHLIAQASVIEASDPRWPVARVVEGWARTGLIARARAAKILA